MTFFRKESCTHQRNYNSLEKKENNVSRIKNSTLDTHQRNYNSFRKEKVIIKMRVRFEKGKQREFILLVLDRIGCPSLRALKGFGFDINYSSLKNYFNESRSLPLELFNDLCYISKVDKSNLGFEVVKDSWGQVLGGRKRKKERKLDN